MLTHNIQAARRKKCCDTEEHEIETAIPISRRGTARFDPKQSLVAHNGNGESAPQRAFGILMRELAACT